MSYNTGIQGKIEGMIMSEVADILSRKTTWKETISDEQAIWRYRDANFLNGSHDTLFRKLIKDLQKKS